MDSIKYSPENQRDFFRKIQKKFSITYYYSTSFFPMEVREKVWVLYSFLRIVDEIVDNPIAEPRTTLEAFQKAFWHQWKNQEKNGQHTTGKRIDEKTIIINSFIELALTFKFEKSWIEAFFHSMAMDLTIDRYKNYDGLLKYIYGSAEVVGLMMNVLMGGTPQGQEAAKMLGRAMQLTNFLRDIKEDFERGRIYVPQEDLLQFKITEKDFQNNSSTKFINLLKFEITRVKEQYEHVLKNVHYIPQNSRLAVVIATYVYLDVLERIAKSPEQLWSRNFKKTFLSFPKAILKSRKLLKQYKKTNPLQPTN